MNEPFLLSNLIDLQEIDNKLFKLIESKSSSENVNKLKDLEIEFKDLTSNISEQINSLEKYFSIKENNEKSLKEIKLKIKDIEMKLSSDNLDPTDTLNFSNQKESLKIQTNKLREEIENIESENFDEIDVLEKDKENLEEVKTQLVVVAKLVKSEWDLIDQQIPILENEKSKFISTFPDEFKIFYDNLKKVNFPLDTIKKYTLYENNRWDLKTKDNKVIKLPSKNYKKSLENFLKLKSKNNLKKYELFDYRISNQLILK